MQVKNAEKWGARGVLLFPESPGFNPTREVMPTWVIRADSVRPPGYGDPLTPELPSTGRIPRNLLFTRLKLLMPVGRGNSVVLVRD